MDLNHVSIFVRVVQDGSFTAAAKALGIPKSSVSRSIAQLEENLGVRLLHRTTRKLHLTDAGAAFHDRVARALADIDDAQNAAADLQRELRGSIRVTAPLDLGVWAVAGIVSRFVRKHPTVHVEVRLGSRIVDLVSEGYDLAVRAGKLRDQSLIARRVGNLEMCLFASSKYLARRGQPQSLADVAKHDCVLLQTESGPLAWKLVGPDDREQTVEARGAITSDDISFLKKSVLAGGGIALLPLFMCAREEAAGKLVRVMPEYRLGGSDLHVVYPSARYVPQRVVAFRDYLVRELSSLSRRCEATEKARLESAAPPSRVLPATG